MRTARALCPMSGQSVSVGGVADVVCSVTRDYRCDEGAIQRKGRKAGFRHQHPGEDGHPSGPVTSAVLVTSAAVRQNVTAGPVPFLKFVRLLRWGVGHLGSAVSWGPR